MADQQENAEQQQPGGPQGNGKQSPIHGVFTWVITLAIVVGGGVGGFALAQLIAGAGPKNAHAQPAAPETDVFAPGEEGAGPWQYDLEPVLANLDEPGVTRFLRVTVTLVMAPEMDATKGGEFLKDKAPLLTDFVSGYISGLTLEQVRGQNNRNHIKREVQYGFNQVLFPDGKPYVHNVLFREFAVQ
jgi:flagellar basal body-associated protein FliL